MERINGVELETSANVARQLGISPQAVKAALDRGSMRGMKIGNNMFIPVSEILRYRQNSLNQPGRKKD